MKVVWLEYPRPGLWALGFVTGTSQSEDGEPYYNIFVPTTPNPTSGYVVFTARKDTIEADLSIEEGFKLLISGGALSRGSHHFRYDHTKASSAELPTAAKKSGKGRGNSSGSKQ